jgi:hypothetical protein
MVYRFFSLKAGSHLEENVGSASVSVGELWPEIDLLDEVGHGGTSMVLARGPSGDQTSQSRVDPQRSRNPGEGSLRVNLEIQVGGAPGSSSAPPHGYGGGSAKNKTT